MKKNKMDVNSIREDMEHLIYKVEAQVFTEKISSNVTKDQLRRIKKHVKDNPDLYTNHAHYIRVAVMRQIRLDDEQMRARKVKK